MENTKFLKGHYMKSLHVVLLVLVLIFTTGCYNYSDISGRVIDIKNGKPIEGAVVVAQWTKPRGMPGEQYHDLHKIIETLTDKDGKFSLSGVTGFRLDPPEMIIYKDGYIPWRNDRIFPSCNIVKDHEWKNNMTYKLEVFSNKYTFRQLYSFLDCGIMGHYRNEVPNITNVMYSILKLEQEEIKNKMRP